MNIETTSTFASWGYIGVGVVACAILAATAIASYVVVKLVRRVLHRATDGDIGGSIIANILRVAIWALGISLVLQNCLGMNPSVIWGALGVGGIAISLGMQNTVSNLIGGLQLSLSRDVGVGDWVIIGSNPPAKVVDINWRMTKLVDETGVKALVPNSVINSTSVQVLTDAYGLMVDLALATDAKLDELEPRIIDIAYTQLVNAGMNFGETKPVLSIGATTVDSISTQLKVFASRDFNRIQINNAIMPELLSYLQDQGALAHCYSGS